MGLTRTGYLTLMLAAVPLGSALMGVLCSGWARQQRSSIIHQGNVANGTTVGDEHSEGGSRCFHAWRHGLCWRTCIVSSGAQSAPHAWGHELNVRR